MAFFTSNKSAVSKQLDGSMRRVQVLSDRAAAGCNHVTVPLSGPPPSAPPPAGRRGAEAAGRRQSGQSRGAKAAGRRHSGQSHGAKAADPRGRHPASLAAVAKSSRPGPGLPPAAAPARSKRRLTRSEVDRAHPIATGECTALVNRMAACGTMEPDEVRFARTVVQAFRRLFPREHRHSARRELFEALSTIHGKRFVHEDVSICVVSHVAKRCGAEEFEV